MATIASCSQVVEIKSQVGTLRNGYLVVSMQMAFAFVMSVAKLGKHSVGLRLTHLKPAIVGDNVRLPSAINAAPAVTLEAQNSEASVVGVVPTFDRRTAT